MSFLPECNCWLDFSELLFRVLSKAIPAILKIRIKLKTEKKEMEIIYFFILKWWLRHFQRKVSEDGIQKNFLGTTYKFYKLFMNFSQNFPKLLAIFFTTFLQYSNKLRTYFLQNFLWTSNDLLTSFLWTSYNHFYDLLTVL